MRSFRPGQTYKAPYFTPSQIDNMCCDELRGVSLLPSSPEPIRIDRFIEKRFSVSPQYEDLPDGVLGFTRFGRSCCVIGTDCADPPKLIPEYHQLPAEKYATPWV